MFTWILAQWEEYHTSIMLYGNSYYGVLEANYCIAALHIVTFIVGPQLWRTPATDVLPLKMLEGVRERRRAGRRLGRGALVNGHACRAWVALLPLASVTPGLRGMLLQAGVAAVLITLPLIAPPALQSSTRCSSRAW